jgi:hypothetical protein
MKLEIEWSRWNRGGLAVFASLDPTQCEFDERSYSLSLGRLQVSISWLIESPHSPETDWDEVFRRYHWSWLPFVKRINQEEDKGESK